MSYEHLNGDEILVNPEVKRRSESSYIRAAQRIARVDDSWKMASIVGKSGGTLVQLAQTTKFARGARKGETKYLRPFKDVIVSDRENQEEKQRIRDEGTCVECLGAGLQCTGWTAGVGTKYRKCPKCNGTGNHT